MKDKELKVEILGDANYINLKNRINEFIKGKEIKNIDFRTKEEYVSYIVLIEYFE